VTRFPRGQCRIRLRSPQATNVRIFRDGFEFRDVTYFYNRGGSRCGSFSPAGYGESCRLEVRSCEPGYLCYYECQTYAGSFLDSSSLRLGT
jgi:hypothetical protein